MGNTSRMIIKNASFMMASQLITWTLAMIVTIALPRYLGASAVGKYSLSTSLLAITTIFAGFGMERMMTKEIAREPEKLDKLLGTVIILRFGLFFIGYILLAAYARLMHYPPDTIAVILLLCVAFLFEQMSSIFSASLQGLERMEFISISAVVTKTFSTVVILILLVLKQGLMSIALVSIGSAIINFSILAYGLRKVRNAHFTFDYHLVKWILKISYPYMMSMAFLILYQKMDIVVISWLANEYEIGWYSASSTLFGSLLFIPTIFMTVVFPTLSRLNVVDINKAIILVRKSFDLLLLLGVPIGLGMLTISKPLVLMLYGPEFSGSGPILGVMGIVTILTYLNILLGQYMVSSDRQNTWTIIMAVAAASTIPLDLLFMPWCRAQFGNGAIGGGLSFLVTELGRVIAGMILIPRGMLGRSNLVHAAKVLLAGAIMSAIVWQLRDSFIAIPIFAGAIVYMAIILLLGVIHPDDWELLKSSGSSALARISKNKMKPTAASRD